MSGFWGVKVHLLRTTQAAVPISPHSPSVLALLAWSNFVSKGVQYEWRQTYIVITPPNRTPPRTTHASARLAGWHTRLPRYLVGQVPNAVLDVVARRHLLAGRVAAPVLDVLPVRILGLVGPPGQVGVVPQWIVAAVTKKRRVVSLRVGDDLLDGPVHVIDLVGLLGVAAWDVPLDVHELVPRRERRFSRICWLLSGC